MEAPNATRELALAVACQDQTTAAQLAQSLGGICYVDDRPDPSKLPFTTLFTTVTDSLEPLRKIGDVGLYLVCRRTIKPGSAAVYGLFPMHKHPHKTHEQADTHWRDNHGPLALQHHAYMSHYVQLSVLHTFSGTPFDGFALCGFNNLTDLKERFFTTEASRKVIAEDVAKFADTDNAARRLIVTPQLYTP
jgi:uncharacterized protein (TIGR02118 family)